RRQQLRAPRASAERRRRVRMLDRRSGLAAHVPCGGARCVGACASRASAQERDVTSDTPRFTEAQVEGILSRAIERAEKDRATLTLDDLVEIGGEVGVSRSLVERAAGEVMEARGAGAVSAPASVESVAIWKKRAWKRWLRHLAVYAAVNAFLIF